MLARKQWYLCLGFPSGIKWAAVRNGIQNWLRYTHTHASITYILSREGENIYALEPGTLKCFCIIMLCVSGNVLTKKHALWENLQADEYPLVQGGAFAPQRYRLPFQEEGMLWAMGTESSFSSAVSPKLFLPQNLCSAHIVSHSAANRCSDGSQKYHQPWRRRGNSGSFGMPKTEGILFPPPQKKANYFAMTVMTLQHI